MIRRLWKKGDKHGKKDDDYGYNRKNSYKNSVLPLMRNSPSTRRSSGGSGNRHNLYSPYNNQNTSISRSDSGGARRKRRSNSMDCLLGGHYYPNKDKKKNFCTSMASATASSSPLSICIIIFVLSIIICLCMLTILVLIFEIEIDTFTHHHHPRDDDNNHHYSHEIMMKKKRHSLQIPKTLHHHHNNNNNNNHDNNYYKNNFVTLQSLEQMYQNAQKLQDKWEKLMNDPNHPYNKNYNIYHIYQDDDTNNNNDEDKGEENNNSDSSNLDTNDADQSYNSEDSKDELQEATNPSRDTDTDIQNNNYKNNNNNNDIKDNNSDPTDHRMMEVNNSSIVPLRTLHNMDTHDQFSSCPNTRSDSIENDVTLVIQSTVDRLPLLSQTCQRWKGPIIVVLYFETQDNETANDYKEEWKQSCPQSTLLPYNHKNNDKNNSQNDKRKSAYPINKLRNIGLDHVTSSHVLVLDIDLIPSNDLYTIVTKYIRSPNKKDDGKQEDKTNTAIIVPAFERNMVKPPCQSVEECLLYLLKSDNDNNKQFFLPSTFEQLQACVFQQKECSVFQSQDNWEGHSTTNSMYWLAKPQTNWYQSVENAKTDNNSNNIDTITKNLEIDFSRPMRTINCMESMRYEPYMILPWCAAAFSNEKDIHDNNIETKVLSPYYDERFHGYGKNKIQQFAHVRVRGTTFQVLPRGFVVHMPHPESVIKQTWNDKDKHQLHSQMDQLYLTYVQELVNHYGSSPNLKKMLPMCHIKN